MRTNWFMKLPPEGQCSKYWKIALLHSLKRHLACSFFQIFYCNWKIYLRRFEIHFCKFLTISYFVQLSIKILHRSANIYWMNAHKDMKLCRKRGTSVSTLTSAAHILLIITATKGIFLNFQHIATAYINGNFK